MSKIAWGKCSVYTKDLDVPGSVFVKTPTPIQDSTTLETSEGELHEAKVEGGQNEDVKHDRDTFALNFNLRSYKGRKLILRDHDGVVDHNYAVVVIPEDPDVAGIKIDKASAYVGKTFNCAEGLARNYKFSALVPDDDSDQVKFGKIVPVKEGDVITDFNCIEEDVEGGDLVATPDELEFAAADAPAQTVNISGATEITSARGNRAWMTVTFSGTEITVTAANNSNTSARSGVLKVVADGEMLEIPVTQDGASAA